MSNLPATPQNLKKVLAMPSVQEEFKRAAGEKYTNFQAALIELATTNTNLQGCQPQDLVKCALKSAILDLPLTQDLGMAYIVPRKIKGHLKPQFQIGYKGLIQLAIRTGQFKTINAGIVYEGEKVVIDKISGEARIAGEPTSFKAVGYFAYFKLLNGFEKFEYWPIEKVIKHTQRYAPSYGSDFSPWKTDFDTMAMKTVLAKLLRVYAPKSIEMIKVLSEEEEEPKNNIAPETPDTEAEIPETYPEKEEKVVGADGEDLPDEPDF